MAKSMALNSAAGLSGMLKSGHRHMEGVDGVTLRNIEAAKGLSSIVASSLGPNGMNKLVVNHLGKIIVTSDCATIVKELEIEHPAARMLQLAAEMQDSECGDGTNLTVSFAGELLKETEELLRMGLHTSEIIQGYKKAGDYLQKVLPSLVVSQVTDPRNKDELVRICKPVLAAKQAGSEDILAPLVAEACLGTMNPNGKPKVHTDGVRVAKILGGNVGQSQVILGMVLLRGAETTLTHVESARITVFGCGIEAASTEAKGTVLMKDANDLMNYNKSEEAKMDEIVKSISETGTKVIVCGGSVSEMALHFIEKYKMMCIKVASKWDLRRLCSATNSTALVRLGPATSDEIGFCDDVRVKEIGGKFVTVFSQGASAKDGCRIATVLLRASTSSVLNDLERAVDDGVAACRIACKDSRLVPGAGATEMELALQIRQFGDTSPGLDQYAIRSFGKALEFVPRTLAQNSGQEQTDVLAALGAAHANGEKTAGVDVSGSNNGVFFTGDNLVDLYSTKSSAFRLAVDAALTVLRVDQIIMSKAAGGGKTMQ
mmetsp:Transcript_25842/g.40082  ORF Transcript_25842/g.40082 Transcript_25842/m.40082 type:complete len:544 (+) Transcript_25842:139-1770(+)|eukprot:CAMPEP_0196816378 /NCGR_PEP_ID=MMETSP1362-20130617/54977_1 /TAXON_ID=163516 /ORGANISM="Leptocylindrus danicus, Strain CCMP1856" /LENGTH=543 /DNA_ID=CAMNT_0042193685 /DNA_START=63 /DNA_END=1694 /DNA_ORIENTATION=-